MVARLLLAVTVLVPLNVWSQTITSRSETQPFPGVRIVALRTSGPTTNAWATYVDLCADGIHVEATSAPSSMRTSQSLGESLGAQLVVNGDFHRWSPPRVHGQAVGGGVPWPSAQTGVSATGEWFYQRYGWIAFGRDWVDFTHTKLEKESAATLGLSQGFRPGQVTHDLPLDVGALVSGFPALVSEGSTVTCGSGPCFPDRGDMTDGRYPRTAMGLTRDRRVLVFLTVDGRTTASAGMYGVELAKLMSELGAYQAFNIDGGGSSQLWVKGQGYVNNVSGNNFGGGARAVANHWAIFAGTGHSKGSRPGHCLDYLSQAAYGPPHADEPKDLDVDGDGRADVCIRSGAGLRCALGGGSGQQVAVSHLSDSLGFDEARYAASVRFGDLDGDGRTDACARGSAGVTCFLSTSEPFATVVTGPPLADSGGWSLPQYGATLRLADVTGDGKDDLCARASGGLRCYPSLGTSFGAVIQTAHFTDAEGFSTPDKYGSLRFGDFDGDGLKDVCGRSAEGVRCLRSHGTSFSAPIAGPTWTDEQGFTDIRHWSTLRMGDVDGDGRADLCARTPTDFRCHLSTGAGFASEPVTLSVLSNASGWGDRDNNFTLRLGDIDGDGALDVCARANAGVRCWKWTGAGFGQSVTGPALSNAQGFDDERFYSTFRLGDVTGDRRADVCVRDGSGLRCWPSTGSGFGAEVKGPAWAGQGYESWSAFGTMSLSSRAARVPAAPDAGVPSGTDGGEPPDSGLPGSESLDAGPADSGLPGSENFDAGPADQQGSNPPPEGGGAVGCGCQGAAGGALPFALWTLLMLAQRRCVFAADGAGRARSR